MRKRTRLTRAITIAVFAAIGLTACSVQGNKAEEWLSTSPIIESSKVRLAGCEAMCDPEVTGTIVVSASEEDVRELAESATRYLSDSKSSDVEMNLSYGKVDFDIGATQEETSSSLDLALAAHSDDRVSSAHLGSGFSSIVGATADLTTLYAQYSGQKTPLSLNANDEDEGSHFLIKEGPPECDNEAPLVAEFDKLLLDPSVSSLRLEFCSMFEVTVVNATAKDAMIAEMQTFASDPIHSSVAFSVLLDGELPYPVTFDTAERLAYLELIASTPGVVSSDVKDAVITVEVDDPSLLRSVVSSINAVPKPGSLDHVRFTSGSISIFLDGDGTIEAQREMAESLFAVEPGGEDLFFRAEAQSDGGFTLSPREYDSEVGRQVVDVIIASGLSPSFDMEISVDDSPVQFAVTVPAGSSTFEIENSNEDRGNLQLIDKLTTYWGEQLANQ